ncbi:DUF4376 domain-containing protein [Pseudomonas panipatensis]|uniref:DUF4376 domain-containing protein n=1 Tax=Pseudomonas panipatensis TaxID=428992 RepID=A0A1G8LDT5_9PSED|nr:DUF4376 domain-containing protein [Pseudomonas panipatensis]SDI53869.1 protein of unknown function [Pseudomonas panipatensis]SMP75090.1 protein of unknown function [Pseudomonas panipatensis]
MMKTYARIEDVVVVELFETDGDISEMFHPDLVWVVVPDGADVACGWTYAAGKFSAPVVPAPTAEEMKAKIAERRWQQVQAGTNADGVHLDTSDTSQVKITGAALEATLDSTYSCDWKAADGSWVTLSATQILAIARAMRAYIQACYDREKALAEEVDAGTFTEAMLDEGWPT